MAQKRRQLTNYGRWVKMLLIDKDMTLSQLAETVGVDVQYLSKMMYGYYPGHKYRAKVETALGATPPANIAS